MCLEEKVLSDAKDCPDFCERVCQKVCSVDARKISSLFVQAGPVLVEFHANALFLSFPKALYLGCEVNPLCCYSCPVVHVTPKHPIPGKS